MTVAPGTPIRVYLHAGEVHCAVIPTIVSTVLGSCVSVCLWDPVCSLSGLNHFILPIAGPMEGGARFGDYAIDALIEGVNQLGCSWRLGDDASRAISVRRGDPRCDAFGGPLDDSDRPDPASGTGARQVPTLEMVPRITDVYTMASERTIHARVLGEDCGAEPELAAADDFLL